MLYSLAADTLLFIHLVFIIFVVLGGLLVMKWRWLVYLHLPAVVWGALIEFFSWRCPLTPWEIAFRQAGGDAGYKTGFIQHYLGPLVYPAHLDYNMQVILGSFVIVINLVIYAWLLSRIKKQH